MHTRDCSEDQEALRPIDVATQSDIVFRVIGNKALFAGLRRDKLPPTRISFLSRQRDRDRFLRKAWPDISASRHRRLCRRDIRRTPVASDSIVV
jgi:hypothetical protein